MDLQFSGILITIFYLACVSLPVIGLVKTRYKKCFAVLSVIGFVLLIYRPISLTDEVKNTKIINSYDVPIENVEEGVIIKNVPDKYNP